MSQIIAPRPGVKQDSPLNQMQAARGVHDARDAAGLQGEGGLLELLLHITLAEVAEVAALPGAAAVGLGDGKVLQGGLAALDALLVALDDLPCVVLGARDGGLWGRARGGQRVWSLEARFILHNACP